MRIHIGNLSFKMDERELRSLFSHHGEVTDLHIPTDRETGRPRGFAFVTMDSAQAMNNAIEALNGKEQRNGRILKVNEARPR